MKLRKKTLLIIAVTTISMITIVYAASQIILLSSFAKLEEQNIHLNAERALSALSDELSGLNSAVGDWAEWDDAYAFVLDHNEDFIKTNLADQTFINVRLNLILFIDTSGQVVYGKAFDLENMTEVPVPQSILDEISISESIWRYNDTSSRITGVILLPEDPLLIASRPLLTSQGEGPIHGTLIFARYLNMKEIQYLAEITHLSTLVYRFSDSSMPPDFQLALSRLSGNESIFVQPLNTDIVAGYARVNDVYNNPALLWRVDMPRDIYKQGQSTITYFILSLFAVSLVFGAATLLLLEKVILSRLTRLIADVNAIGKNKDLSARVTMSGNDELSTLAKTTNSMLSEIEDKTMKLRDVERLATIGEVATMVGHDLRNPLTGINTAVYYLKRKLGSSMDREAKEMFELIEKDIEHSNKIVNDLFEYSREPWLELTETSPKSIINESLSLVEVPKNIKILDLTENDLKMKVDVERIKRAFVNIIKNAIDAMSEGGTLTIRSEKSNGNMEFMFSDTGVGMSKETLEKLWKPLFTTKAKGMGLGLPICKRIIEAHKGDISVESAVGRGTTFTVTIPIKPKFGGGEKGWLKQPESLLLTTRRA